MIGALFLIIIGIMFFLLGWYLWDHIDTSELVLDSWLWVVLISWILSFLMVILGIASLFNHAIADSIFDSILHSLTANKVQMGAK